MTSNAFPEEQQANALTTMLLCCRLSIQPENEPLSPPEYHAVVRALSNHGLPAVAVEHMGREAKAALQQASFDSKQIERIAALGAERTGIRMRAAEWKIHGITSVAYCQDEYPAQLRNLDDHAPPVIHLKGNQALLDVDPQQIRPVLTEWAMSPRAEAIVTHVAAEIVEGGLTLATSTAHQAGRMLLEETLALGGKAVAIVDGTPLQQITQTSATQQQLDGGRLLLLSTHEPNHRVHSTQHRSQRLLLALGGDHVDLRTGRRPRATIQERRPVPA